MRTWVRCLIFPPLVVLAIAGCSITRNVRPVGAGNAAAGLSLGGPFFTNLGPPVPVPLIALFGRYGVTNRLDVDLGLHMPTVRAVGIDAGAAYLVLEPAGGVPAVMLGARLALLGNGRAMGRGVNPNTGKLYALEPHLFEEIYGTASWQVGDWLLYSGLSAFMQLERGNVRPTLYAGTQWRVVPRVALTAEAKWMAFLTDQSHHAVSWQGIAGYGGFALQLGAQFFFAPGTIGDPA